MEICDRVSSIVHVVGRFPRTLRFIVPDPIDEVKEPAPHELGIQNCGHLMVWRAVHNDRRWRRHDTTREGVGMVRLEEADVEDGMEFHRGRQLQAIRRGADLAQNRKRTQTTDIQFGGRTSGSDVAPGQPYFLTRRKYRSWFALPIGRDFHRPLGFAKR